MNKYYYIIANLPAEPNDIEDGARIVQTNNDILELLPEIGEGPYKSLNELKRSSEIYNSLLIFNPKRALHIIEDHFLIKADPIIYQDDGSEYLKHIFNIMHHSNYGKVDRNGVFGIHLYDPHKIKITELTKDKNEHGIWEAKIEVYNPNSRKWIKKNKPTTFFPDNWNLQKLICECRPAFDERMKVSERKYIGKSLSGIPVTMIFENEILKSIYPNYE